MIVVMLKVIMIRDNGLCMRAACGSYVIWGRGEKGGDRKFLILTY